MSQGAALMKLNKIGYCLSSKMFDTCMDRRNNNYNALRLILALGVICGHSFGFQLNHGQIDPIAKILKFTYSGHVSVLIFFVLSGIFVTQSILSRESLACFVIKRVTRIYPGLFICLLFSVFIVGPIFTNLHMRVYFSSEDTFSYISKNLELDKLQWRLPGVFTDSEWGLNGSLWTLPLEIRLYAVVALIYLLGAFRKKSSAVLAITLGIIVFYNSISTSSQLTPGAFDLIYAFAAGSLAAIFKKYIPINGYVALFLFAFSFILLKSTAGKLIVYIFIVYFVLYFFSIPRVCRLTIPGDYSYGVYIYGFMVQQCFSHVAPNATPFLSILVTSCVCLLLAILSWHFVEKPCLDFGSRIITIVRAPLKEVDILPIIKSLVFPSAVVSIVFIFSQLSPYLFDSTLLQESDLQIMNFGPSEVVHNEPFNTQSTGDSAMWVKVSRIVSSDSKIVLGKTPLETTVSGSMLTAIVPPCLFDKPGQIPLVIRESINGNFYRSSLGNWIVQ